MKKCIKNLFAENNLKTITYKDFFKMYIRILYFPYCKTFHFRYINMLILFESTKFYREKLYCTYNVAEQIQTINFSI